MEQLAEILNQFLGSLGLPGAVVAAIGVVAGYLLKAVLGSKSKPEELDETETDDVDAT